jgi:hypothetical protein
MLYLVVLIVSLSPVKDDTVAIIELNHVHGRDWNHRFDQFIFWEFKHHLDPQGERPTWSYHVRDWRMAEPGTYRLRKEKGKWVLMLWDDGIIRKIQSVSFRETTGNYDREILERKRLSIEHRHKLMP